MRMPSTHDLRSRRRTGTAAAMAAAAAATSMLLSPAAAVADDPAASRLTAVPSSYQVDPGEQFVIHGRLMSEGAPVTGASIRVRSYNDDGWANITGARVTTNDEGRYRVRIVLFRKGDRLLRVVANPSGDAIRNSRAQVLLQVGPAPRNP